MINDIKAKIPSKKKSKSDDLDEENLAASDQDRTDPNFGLSGKTAATDVNDIDEDDIDDAPVSIVDKLKAKLGGKKAAISKDKEPKKNINPVVLILVVGVGIWFLLDEEEPAPATNVEQPLPSRKKPVAQETPPTAVEEPAVAVTPEAEAPVDTAETSVPDATTTTETTPVDSTVAEPTVTDPTITDPTITDTSTAVVTEPTPEPSAEPSPAVTQEPVIEEPVVTDLPTETPSSVTAPESVDSVDGEVVTDDSTMTDKILEDLEKQVKKDQPKEVKKEYVSPPDYEYKGRGLVYNCAGKHWACVDAPSYKTCEDNYSSVTYKNKTVECYPFNVYESSKGCESMQNRVVSSNAKTGFCKGN